MAHSKKRKSPKFFSKIPKHSGKLFFICMVVLIGTYYFSLSQTPHFEAQVVLANEDPNFHVKTITSQFFEDNDAVEMIPVIRCESHFRQFEDDGTPLKNREGSSAIGVAQILASKHPDPKIVSRYNKKFDMDMEPEDFDITTLEGNLGYALILYKIRGTRDWECGKKFSF